MTLKFTRFKEDSIFSLSDQALAFHNLHKKFSEVVNSTFCSYTRIRLCQQLVDNETGPLKDQIIDWSLIGNGFQLLLSYDSTPIGRQKNLVVVGGPKDGLSVYSKRGRIKNFAVNLNSTFDEEATRWYDFVVADLKDETPGLTVIITSLVDIAIAFTEKDPGLGQQISQNLWKKHSMLDSQWKSVEYVVAPPGPCATVPAKEHYKMASAITTFSVPSSSNVRITSC